MAEIEILRYTTRMILLEAAEAVKRKLEARPL